MQNRDNFNNNQYQGNNNNQYHGNNNNNNFGGYDNNNNNNQMQNNFENISAIPSMKSVNNMTNIDDTLNFDEQGFNVGNNMDYWGRKRAIRS